MEVTFSKYKYNLAGRELICPLNQSCFVDQQSISILKTLENNHAVKSLPIYEAQAYFEAISYQNSKQKYRDRLESFTSEHCKLITHPQYNVQRLRRGTGSHFRSAESVFRVINKPSKQYLLDSLNNNSPLYDYTPLEVLNTLEFMNLFYRLTCIQIEQDLYIRSFHVGYRGSDGLINVIFSIAGQTYKLTIKEFSASNYQIKTYVNYNVLVLAVANFIHKYLSQDISSSSMGRDFQCPICLEDDISTALNPIRFKYCNHTACKGCWDRWSKIKNECPYCTQRVTTTRPVGKPFIDAWQSLFMTKYWKVKVMKNNSQLLNLVRSIKVEDGQDQSHLMINFLDKLFLMVPQTMPCIRLRDQVNLGTSARHLIMSSVPVRAKRVKPSAPSLIFIGDYMFREIIRKNRYQKIDVFCSLQSHYGYSMRKVLQPRHWDRLGAKEYGDFYQIEFSKLLQILFNLWLDVADRAETPSFRRRKQLEIANVRVCVSSVVLFGSEKQKLLKDEKRKLQKDEKQESLKDEKQATARVWKRSGKLSKDEVSEINVVFSIMKKMGVNIY